MVDEATRRRQEAGEAVGKKAGAWSPAVLGPAMGILAALVGILLLLAGYLAWASPPAPQVAKVTIGGTEEVVTKKTETTEGEKTVVVTEPAVAVGGRSESVSIAFLVIGAGLLFAAALPGRDLTLKADGLEMSIATVAVAASKEAEEKAEGTNADAAKVKATGAAAAQSAAKLLPANLREARPGGLRGTLSTLSRGSLGRSLSAEDAAKAAEETISQATEVALAKVLGSTET